MVSRVFPGGIRESGKEQLVGPLADDFRTFLLCPLPTPPLEMRPDGQ
jgi:hypothetical protein